jgi:hypothetical protein
MKMQRKCAESSNVVLPTPYVLQLLISNKFRKPEPIEIGKMFGKFFYPYLAAYPSQFFLSATEIFGLRTEKSSPVPI